MAAPADDSKHWLEPPEWWKKSKPLRWVPILVGLAIVLPGLWVAKEKGALGGHSEKARFTAVVSDPVVFLDSMKSYETLEAVRARLDGAKLQYTVTSVCPASSGKYPPRDSATLVVGTYKHLGIEGKLTLEFFNDRLYDASFIPSELPEYVEKLHAADKRLKRDRNGRAEQVVGNLRVASNVAFANTDVGRSLQTKPLVVWQDLRLVQLLDEWDKRFVAMPGNCS